MSFNEIWHKSFSNTENDRKLGEMAAEVAVQNFDYGYATALFFNSTLWYGVETFLHVFNYTVIVNKGTLNPKVKNLTRQYVIFTDDIDDFQLILDALKDLEIKNTGKFVIVCQSNIRSHCEENNITQLLWAYKIVNVVIIKIEENQGRGYTYYPISDGLCNNTKPIKVASSNYSDKLITNHGDAFGMKLKKLSFCPLLVSTFIQSPYIMKIINGTPIGADGDILRIIAYALNTTLVTKTPHRGHGWGLRLENGIWTGSLADLLDDLANISMTSAALTVSRSTDFQLSRSYYTVSLVWVTHPAMLQDEALKLLHPFGPTTRIALIVSYVLVVLCAFVIKTEKWSIICHAIQEDQPSKSIVFYSWMICMGQAIIKLPKKPAFLQIAVLWVYYCFLIRTAYQVYLISSLKGKFYEDQFNIIDDAMKANYPFGGGAALRDYYIDYPEIYDSWIVIDTAEIVPTALNISQGHKFVLAMNRDAVKALIKEHKVSLHILPRKVVVSPAVIFAKKYSPLLESINLILSRLVASGLVEKLHKKYTSVKTEDHVDADDFEKLKIKHFTACYIILTLGIILSLLFFSLELYFGKFYTHPMLEVP